MKRLSRIILVDSMSSQRSLNVEEGDRDRDTDVYLLMCERFHM